MPVDLFPFAQYWWLYAAFTGFVLLLLALDLGVFHRNAHAVCFREAAAWSAVWVFLALAFALGLYHFALWRFSLDPRLTSLPGFEPTDAAWKAILEFLTGYVVEKSLSVDNIFVFVVVFSYFAIPPQYQHRVLFYGILGALLCRAVFIGMGSILMGYHWIVLLFGAFLIFTGLKMMVAPEKGVAPDRNPIIRLFRAIRSGDGGASGPALFRPAAWKLPCHPALRHAALRRADGYHFRRGFGPGHLWADG